MVPRWLRVCDSPDSPHCWSLAGGLNHMNKLCPRYLQSPQTKNLGWKKSIKKPTQYAGSGTQIIETLDNQISRLNWAINLLLAEFLRTPTKDQKTQHKTGIWTLNTKFNVHPTLTKQRIQTKISKKNSWCLQRQNQPPNQNIKTPGINPESKEFLQNNKSRKTFNREKHRQQWIPKIRNESSEIKRGRGKILKKIYTLNTYLLV